MQKRNIGLDIIKGFAALLVCMLHLLRVDFGSVIPGEIYFPNLSKIIYGLCACSVPLFFFVNGYLVGFRQNKPGQIFRKIVNLFKLRIVWGGDNRCYYVHYTKKNIHFFKLQRINFLFMVF